MNTTEFSRGIDLKRIHVTDEFWGGLMDTVRREVIPYQWAALNDEVEGAEPSYCMRNFKLAAKLAGERREKGAESLPVYPVDDFHFVPENGDGRPERFYGFVFQDTDFSKWIEAVGYSLAAHPDKELEKVADGAIDIVCEAQYEDGYLDTFYIINDPSKRFTNLRDHHELYCFGHLAEGAIAYYEATGKDKLLKAAMRFADFICRVFGNGEGKRRGIPGHEIAEMALCRLYETTGERRYLELACFFINERGKKPYFFDEEHGIKRSGETEDYFYHQAHRPVREQDEAVGHAVRAVYLYTGMVMAAKYTGDDSLKEACERLWNNIETEKLYITGGIGATPEGEAFSYPYHLPNDRMYNETCASIGLVFFARRMLEMSPEGRYGDVMERALYNGVISGMALDGKSFFYVNPLEAEPEGCRLDDQRKHVVLPRQKWFGCACCPPNLCRMISSIAQYAYSLGEDTLWLHLFCGAEFDVELAGTPVHFSVCSGYPWKEDVKIGVTCRRDVKFTFAVRVPGWCQGFSVCVNGEKGEYPVRKGYLYVTRNWKNGDCIYLNLPMEPVFYQVDTRVRDDIGKVALMRGPVVYCAEEADNGAGLHLLEVNVARRPEAKETEGELGRIVTLEADGRRICPQQTASLYKRFQGYTYKRTKVKYIPYYTWCNRGAGEMKTYLTWYEAKEEED